ncbi:MAG TPA: glycine cleavage system aminomethyltransferase GcvT [Vicinamibacterales bacterium]|nr:glycine cleavage system aminomethyltransferase GcvT [Vicinamibacterales bacterium]
MYARPFARQIARPARHVSAPEELRALDSTRPVHPACSAGPGDSTRMSQAPSSSLKRTPLNARHRALGARLVDFAGWDMPVEYSGIVDEHMAVRTRAGLFDVSHMGQLEIAGRDALRAVQHITSNDAARLSTGQAQYSALTTPEGTFVDDVLTYRLADDHFMLVVNASNIAKDFRWVSGKIAGIGDAVAVNTSSRYALLALQGPASRDVLQTLTGVPLGDIRYYWFTTGEIAGVAGTISRTGYTGEDGFEVFVPPAAAERVWDSILEAGRAAGVVPAGLGARDTLRLEAAMRLYGNDIDETTTVLEADLGWIVGWKKDEFLGAGVLRRQKADGVSRRLVGFEVLDRAIARHGYAVYVGVEKAGTVTSGTQTPYLKKAIGMAYLPVERTAPDTEFEIDVRGRRVRAQVVPMPFYKRQR